MEPTRTRKLKISSATYVQTAVTAEAFGSTAGGLEAMAEKITQDSAITSPSRQTPAYERRKFFPTLLLGSPANVANGIGAIAA